MPARGITTFGLAHPPPSPPGDTLRGWGRVGPLRNVSERATPLPAGDLKGPPSPSSSALAPTDQDHPASPIRSMVSVDDSIDGCYKKCIHFFILIVKLTLWKVRIRCSRQENRHLSVSPTMLPRLSLVVRTTRLLPAPQAGWPLLLRSQSEREECALLRQDERRGKG